MLVVAAEVEGPSVAAVAVVAVAAVVAAAAVVAVGEVAVERLARPVLGGSLQMVDATGLAEVATL